MDDKQRLPTGIGVDQAGGPVIDPTANVIALSEALSQRQDDLREAEKRYNDLRDTHHEQLATLRAEHLKELAIKETSRLDSVRHIDREDVAKTAASAALAITTLAKQTTDLANTLQTQVSNAAQVAENRRTSDMTEVNKRVSALELAYSASAGKQTVADPMMEKMISRVEALVNFQQAGAGKSSGLNAAWIVLLGVVGLAGVLVPLFIQLVRTPAAPPTGTSAPQVIYIPAAPGTMIPSPPYLPSPGATPLAPTK